MKSQSFGKLLLLLSVWCLGLGGLTGCRTDAPPAPSLETTSELNSSGLGGVNNKPSAPASAYPKFVESDFTDAAGLAKRLKEHNGPVADHLYDKFKERPLAQALAQYDVSQLPGPDLKQTLVAEFNQLLTDKGLYNAEAFKKSDVKFSPETLKLLNRYDKLNAPEIELLNRRLLEDAYPTAIVRGPANAVPAAPTTATGEDTQLRNDIAKLKNDRDAQDTRLAELEKKNAEQAKKLADAGGGLAPYIGGLALFLGLLSLALGIWGYRASHILAAQVKSQRSADELRFKWLESQQRAHAEPAPVTQTQPPQSTRTETPGIVAPVVVDWSANSAPRYGASDQPATQPAANAVTDALASRVQYLQQDMTHVQEKLGYNNTALSDAAGAIVELTKWLTETQSQAAGQANRAAQPDTTALRALVNNYDGDLQHYEEAVKPLLQQLNETLNRWHNAPVLTPAVRETLGQMSNRLSSYGVWRNRLTQAQQTAPVSPATDWHGEQQYLDAERQSGRITTAQWIEQKRQLLARQAVTMATTPAAPTLPDETELRRVIAGASAEVMTCYDQLAQLQAQAGASSGWGEELRRLQSTAREVLTRFDLQPEEITLGQTRYDPRLHDLALVRAQSGVPANTILEVLQSGFCQRSTGKTVRRPKVVAAGTGV